MENINTNEMELNNEETVNNETVNATDVIDNVIDADDVIVAEVDSGEAFKTFFKVLLVGGVAVGFAIAANWDKIQEKKYEKLQKKLAKEAAKRGDVVYITKANSETTEGVEESAEVDEDVDVTENV